MLKIEVQGMEKLKDLADRYPRIAQNSIDQAIVRSIGQIDIEVKPLTPVKTGRLRNSLVPVFGPFKGVYGTRVNYASDVHNLYSPGTPYRNPSKNQSAVAGFMTVGLERAIKRVNEVMANALAEIVRQLAK